MQKLIEPLKEHIKTDSLLVQKLTHIRGLNNGKGYSLSLVRKIADGSRNNTEILNLFLEVIESRKNLMNKQ